MRLDNIHWRLGLLGGWALRLEHAGRSSEEEKKNQGNRRCAGWRGRFLLSWTEPTTWYLCMILCKMNLNCP